MHNQRGCHFYDYIGSTSFAIPPVPAVDAEIGVLFCRKRWVTDSCYEVWVVGEHDGVKQWLSCDELDFHPDQSHYAGKVLTFGDNNVAEPAWVPRRTAMRNLRVRRAAYNRRVPLDVLSKI